MFERKCNYANIVGLQMSGEFRGRSILPIGNRVRGFGVGHGVPAARGVPVIRGGPVFRGGTVRVRGGSTLPIGPGGTRSKPAAWIGPPYTQVSPSPFAQSSLLKRKQENVTGII
jgi:hypothetical protein